MWQLGLLADGLHFVQSNKVAICEVGAEGEVVGDHLAASAAIQFRRRIGEYRVQLVKHFLGEDFVVRTVETAAVPCDLAVAPIIEVGGMGVVHIGWCKQGAVELLFATIEADGKVKYEEVVKDAVLAASVGYFEFLHCVSIVLCIFAAQRVGLWVEP